MSSKFSIPVLRQNLLGTGNYETILHVSELDQETSLVVWSG